MKIEMILLLVKLIVSICAWHISRSDLRENKISVEVYWLKMIFLMLWIK